MRATLTTVQLVLAIVVAFAWISVIFLPTSTQIQVGVQGAMMLVLGSVFGVRIVRRNEASKSNQEESEVGQHDSP